MSVYEDIHKRFMFLRQVADVMNRLDPTIDPDMESKVNRLTFLEGQPKTVLDAIRCPQCRLGDLCNTNLDNLYICPENPIKRLVEDFVERYIGNPWPSERFDLNPIQLKIMVLGLSSPSLGVLASRGMGKSVALALIAITWCFFSAKGEDVFIVAPTTNQTEKVYSYVCDFINASKDGMLINGDPSIGYEGIESIRWGQKPQIKWRQGTSFRPACASNTNHGNTMRGQQPTFEIIDESSYIRDDIYYRTLKAGMGSKRSDHDNIIVESGTPDMKNHFHDLFFDKHKFGHYQRIKFDYQDGIKCGRYSQDKINQVMVEAGGYDSEEFKSEFRCIFPESITNFFRNIEYCFSNTNVEPFPMPGMTYIAGLDLGRMIDSTVLTIGRYEVTSDGDRIDVVHIMEINPSEDLTYPEQYERICEELAVWRVQTCYVDHTGPGIPIYESLVQLAQNKNLSTSMIPFDFHGDNKYHEFMRLRGLMQTAPIPRIRYPDVNYKEMYNHPDYDEFVKANEEYRDIIQKRTNSETEKSKYKVLPAKSRGHDDYVASCICLISGVSDSYNNQIAVISKPNGPEKKEKAGSKVGYRLGKGFNRRRAGYTWRQI